MTNRAPSVFRDVFKVTAGVAVSQAVSFAVLPLLSRLYTPGDWGVMSVYASILGFLVTAAGLFYHIAIPFPPSDQEEAAEALTGLAFWINILLTAAVAVISPVLLERALPPAYIHLLPAGFLLISMYYLYGRLAIRKSDFGLISASRIIQGVSGNGVRLAVPVLLPGSGPLGLVLGQIFTLSGGVAVMTARYFGVMVRSITSPPRRMLEVAKRYRKFPLISIPSHFIFAFGANLLLLSMAWRYGDDTAGQLGMALTISQVPLALVKQGIESVFSQRAASAYPGGEDGSVVETFFVPVTAVFVPFSLAAAMAAPAVFPLVLGENWRLSGMLALTVIPFVGMQIISAPLPVGGPVHTRP